jgi:hypothetical protein
VSLSLYSSPPPIPLGRCIGYNFDGTNVDWNDHSKLKYEDGSAILNIEEYLK